MAAQGESGGKEADRAGRSAQAEYERRRANWWTSRMPVAARWVPPALIVGVLAGGYLAVATHIRFVGALLAALVVGAVLDLVFHPPHVLRDWRDVADGERSTAKLLARFERNGYVAFHDRTSAASRTHVEHVLIGPTGMYVLDSRNWTRMSSEPRVFAGRLFLGREAQDEMLDGLRERANRVSEEITAVLTDDEEPVAARSIVLVHGVQVNGTPRVLRDVAVVEAGQLTRYLQYAETIWSTAQVRAVVAAAERVLRLTEGALGRPDLPAD